MIQLWLPHFPMSPFKGDCERDLQRAKREWHNEQTIYLSSVYKEVTRWEARAQEGSLIVRDMAVPSETTNIIVVVNVDKEGNCFPAIAPVIPEQWKGKIPPNLFQKWLNVEHPKIGVTRTTKVLLPEINPQAAENSKIEFKEKTFVAESYNMPGFSSEDIPSHTIRFKWPPEGSNLPRSISPQAEIEKYGKPLNQTKDKMAVWLEWIEPPFNEMFLLSGSLDYIYYSAWMKDLIKRNNKKEIFAWRDKYVSKINSPLELAWLYPQLTKNMFSESFNNDFLFDLETKFGISVYKVEELFEHGDYNTFKNREYDKIFKQTVEIPCIFSWIGYFWWELSQTIQDKSVNICERCGSVISGKKDKRFCSKEENPECFRARRAEDRRRERNNNE